MTRKNISDAVGGIDSRRIEETASYHAKKQKNIWLKFGAIAACLCLIVVGAFSMGLFSESTETATLGDGTTISFTKSDTVASALSLNLQARALTKDEIQSIFGDLPISGDALFSLDDAAFVGVDGHYSDMKFVVSLSGNNLMDTTVIGKENVSMVGDTPIKAGYFVTNANSKGIKTVIYYSYITFDNYSVYIENAGGESERGAVRAELMVALDKLLESSFDFSAVNK